MSYHGPPLGHQQDAPEWLQVSGEPAHPIYAAPQYPQHPGKRSLKWVPAFILILVGMLLALSAMFMAWFTVYEDVGGSVQGTSIDMNMQLDFELNSATIKGTITGIYFSQTYTYDSLMSMLELYWGSSTTAQFDTFVDTITYTEIILIIGVVMAIMALILVLVAVLGKIPGYVGGAIGMLSSLFVVMAPLYLMITLPSATFLSSGGVGPQGGFWGSTSQNSMGMSISMTWGAGTGWWLSLVAFVLILIGSVMAFSIQRPAQMAPAVVPPLPMPYPYAQAQPQP